MILYSNCKINLGLNIVSKRSDGYHEIETAMYPVRELCDVVEIVRAENQGVEFSSSGIAVDCPPEKNLCIKAYNLMRERYAIGGVKMHLHKVIPFGAGLGGGSSNAAFVIKGLNELFNLRLHDSTMEVLAAELGSDTSFFVRNVPQLATGRGEILRPIEIDLQGYHLLLVKPNVGVSTAEAYANVTPSKPAHPITEIIASDPHSWRDRLRNDFEESIFPKKIELAEIKNKLYEQGAVYASMSGSGSTLYAIFDKKPNLDEWQNIYFTHYEVMC